MPGMLPLLVNCHRVQDGQPEGSDGEDVSYEAIHSGSLANEPLPPVQSFHQLAAV
jgi:hypothetical protein